MKNGPNFEMVLCDSLDNLIERATIQSVCSQRGITLDYVDNLTELEARLVSSSAYNVLIVCDLADIPEIELSKFMHIIKNSNGTIMGKYPHVSTEIRNLVYL